RKPLVPANQGADLAVSCVVSLEAKVARREIKLLVVKRIVGDMHLAILAVSVYDHSRVVVNTGGAPFKERSKDDDLFLLRHFTQRFGRWTWNCLRKFEEFDVLGLTEVLRTKELLQTNNLRAQFGGIADSRDRLLEVRLRLWVAAHLDQPDLNDIRLRLFRHARKY